MGLANRLGLLWNGRLRDAEVGNESSTAGPPRFRTSAYLWVGEIRGDRSPVIDGSSAIGVLIAPWLDGR